MQLAIRCPSHFKTWFAAVAHASYEIQDYVRIKTDFNIHPCIQHFNQLIALF